MPVLQPRRGLTVAGPVDAPPVVLLHGFGTDRTIWDRLVPDLARDHRVVAPDHAGSGEAPPGPAARYRHLDAYVDDVLALLDEGELVDATLVGFSVGGAIALAAAAAAPGRVGRLVLIGTSPRYLDDDGYEGGFTPTDVDALVATIEDNYLAWTSAMAAPLLGREDPDELTRELEGRLQHLDPAVATTFARATFHADVRHLLPEVAAPTLVLQCRDDAIVPDATSRWLADHLPDGRHVQLEATGHCPLLSSPDEVRDHVRAALTAAPV